MRDDLLALSSAADCAGDFSRLSPERNNVSGRATAGGDVKRRRDDGVASRKLPCGDVAAVASLPFGISIYFAESCESRIIPRCRLPRGIPHEWRGKSAGCGRSRSREGLKRATPAAPRGSRFRGSRGNTRREWINARSRQDWIPSGGGRKEEGRKERPRGEGSPTGNREIAADLILFVTRLEE